LAVVGVFLARIDVFITLENTQLFSVSAIGIILALAGIAVYATGMPRILKKAMACPKCYTKNEASARVCKKCKKVFS